MGVWGWGGERGLLGFPMKVIPSHSKKKSRIILLWSLCSHRAKLLGQTVSISDAPAASDSILSDSLPLSDLHSPQKTEWGSMAPGPRLSFSSSSRNSHCLETCMWRMQTSTGHRSLGNFLCGWSIQKVREIMFMI